MEIQKPSRRRRYHPEAFKQAVIAACCEPGASVAVMNPQIVEKQEHFFAGILDQRFEKFDHQRQPASLLKTQGNSDSFEITFLTSTSPATTSNSSPVWFSTFLSATMIEA
jgi:hypothetical protein